MNLLVKNPMPEDTTTFLVSLSLKAARLLSKRLLISDETFMQFFATIAKNPMNTSRIKPQSLYKTPKYATGAKYPGQSRASAVPYPSWGFQPQSDNETSWYAQEWATAPVVITSQHPPIKVLALTSWTHQTKNTSRVHALMCWCSLINSFLPQGSISPALREADH